jgi:hypothetical protein
MSCKGERKDRNDEGSVRATVLVATARPNKSLDASGGSVFRIIIGSAMLE